MACRKLAQALSRAADTFASQSRTQCARATRSLQPPTSATLRCISTTASRPAEVDTETQEPFTAARPFDLDAKDRGPDAGKKLLRTLRIVPASPSYFSAKPTFTDDFLSLSALLRKVATLPIIPNAEAPKVAWKTVEQYRIMTNEPVKTQRYHKMLHLLRRLNCINPQLMPGEVLQALQRYKKPSQPGDIQPKPGVIDELGRAKGVGRRKTSSAVAWLVEGEGEVLINGQSLTDFFGRLHLRESAVWALKATGRLDKYNLFALVNGGGSTGQAEAMTLAVAKALLVHEPALKPALRRGESSNFSSLILFASCFPFLSLSARFCKELHLPDTTTRGCFVHILEPSFLCMIGIPSLTLPTQLAALLVTPGRWRGRSPVTSRPAKCLPGSSVKLASFCTSFRVSSYLLAFSEVECKMIQIDRTFGSKSIKTTPNHARPWRCACSENIYHRCHRKTPKCQPVRRGRSIASNKHPPTNT